MFIKICLMLLLILQLQCNTIKLRFENITTNIEINSKTDDITKC